MFNWQETALSVVNHSLRVSESCSFQFEYHSGAHCVKLLKIGVSSITSPHLLQIFSPLKPSG